MKPITLSIVVDTDVMVAAFDSPTGASRHLLLAVADKQVRMLISPALMSAYEAVLTRAGFLHRSELDTEANGHALDELAALSVPVLRPYSWRPGALREVLGRAGGREEPRDGDRIEDG